jgi:hypothetical protein
MNLDDFEKQIQRQLLRPVPSEWREEILRRATPAPRASAIHRLSLVTRHFLWPHPGAWAALAMSWIVIVTVQLACSDRTSRDTKKIERPSLETVTVLPQQTRMLAELFGQPPPKDADRPKPNASQPRSERRTKILIA